MANTKRATMFNWSPKKKRANTSKPKRKANQSSAKAKPKARANKSTAMVRYAGALPAQVNRKKHHKKKKRNGSGGGGLSAVERLTNPLFRGGLQGRAMGAAEIIIFGVGGGAVAKIAAAGELGILDRVLPSVSGNRFAQPGATLLNAFTVVPLVARLVTKDQRKRESAKYGAIITAGADLMDALLGTNAYITNAEDRVRQLTAGTIGPAVETAANTAIRSIAQGAASGAAQAAKDNGLSDADAAAVAQTAAQGAMSGLGGLSGIPSVNDVDWGLGVQSDWQ